MNATLHLALSFRLLLWLFALRKVNWSFLRIAQSSAKPALTTSSATLNCLLSDFSSSLRRWILTSLRFGAIGLWCGLGSFYAESLSSSARYWGHWILDFTGGSQSFDVDLTSGMPFGMAGSAFS